ncbi:MAG: hypothetical protein COU35_03260 [Candidatus Magasanikbacteria bacterium CG10_big_fil_rev_8_21_14_0_10_47_10]|uniref:Kazal-like domain-containing protein n=1 Tax=Candidatus Magasanikbacteria bacterium CG10_big_fil_rev_8_21_14_0_10_47_10 TaxID=1974652 RepID=A0A2H0TQ62_9BACT|nr:MAG: hypothetical protein COU35_03260 [Candidatus Magasanikbacteria bacterium CG10_big_fil_rev_8_21_14_0_10_47_10]
MKQRLTVPLAVALLIVLGAGCGSPKDSDNAQPQMPENQPIDNETVIEGSVQQLSYIYCVQNGHQTTLEYSNQKRAYVLYCAFPDGSRCDASAFQNKECTDETAEMPVDFIAVNRTTVGLISGPRSCPPVANPVCGSDGRTYTNACTAQQRHIDILAEGSCTNLPDITLPNVERYRGSIRVSPPEELSTTQTTDTAPVTTPPQNTTEKTTPTNQPPKSEPPSKLAQAGLPDWLSIPISLLDESNTSARATIEECRIDGNIYYVQIENNDFSILYDATGSLICYPSNDIDSSCPRGFTLATGSCTVVWEK